MSYSEDFKLFSITFLRVKQVIAAYCSYSLGIIRTDYKTHNPNGWYPPIIRYIRISILKGQRSLFSIFINFFYFFQRISKLGLILVYSLPYNYQPIRTYLTLFYYWDYGWSPWRHPFLYNSVYCPFFYLAAQIRFLEWV